MKTELQNSFLYWRAYHAKPATALERARVDLLANTTRYPRTASHGPALGSRMEDGAQWGNPDALGLRFVGWQDEIRREHSYARDLHSGWYTDDNFDEVLRGCVYQLTGRDGRARYIPAYREGSDTRKGWQDTCGEHAAALDFSNVLRGDRGETDYHNHISDTALNAARFADGLAEHAAEKSREYNEAWQAGSQYADTRRELADTRRELRSLVRELKSARSHTPAICKALRASVRDMRADMRDNWRKAQNLRANIWPEYRAAFADGAGLAAFPE